MQKAVRKEKMNVERPVSLRDMLEKLKAEGDLIESDKPVNPDPATVKAGKETVVHDFPAGGWRIKEEAIGVHYTIVNGQVLLEDGEHTGALPGRMIRNSWYHSHRN